MAAGELEELLRRINQRLVALDYEVDRPAEERQKVRRSLVVLHRQASRRLMQLPG